MTNISISNKTGVKGYVTVNSEDIITYVSDDLLDHWAANAFELKGQLLWDVFPLLLFNGFYEEVDQLRVTGCRKFNSLFFPEIKGRIEYSLAPAEQGGLLIRLSLPG